MTPTLCVVGDHHRAFQKSGLFTQVVPVISPLPFSDHQSRRKTELLIESFSPTEAQRSLPFVPAPCQLAQFSLAGN